MFLREYLTKYTKEELVGQADHSLYWQRQTEDETGRDVAENRIKKNKSGISGRKIEEDGILRLHAGSFLHISVSRWLRPFTGCALSQ